MGIKPATNHDDDDVNVAGEIKTCSLNPLATPDFFTFIPSFCLHIGSAVPKGLIDGQSQRLRVQLINYRALNGLRPSWRVGSGRVGSGRVESGQSDQGVFEKSRVESSR